MVLYCYSIEAAKSEKVEGEKWDDNFFEMPMHNCTKENVQEDYALLIASSLEGG